MTYSINTNAIHFLLMSFKCAWECIDTTLAHWMCICLVDIIWNTSICHLIIIMD